LAKNKKNIDPLQPLVSLCKRRGIVFPSSEIYGGIGSTYDYGPYGVEIKNNISKLWWDEMTMKHDNIVGIDSAIIQHPEVWRASGHVGGFNDPMVECKECKHRFRPELIQRTIECQGCNQFKLKVSPVINEAFIDAVSVFGFEEVVTSFRDPAPACDTCKEPTQYKIIETSCPTCGSKNSFTPPRQFDLMFKTNMGPVADENSTTYFRPETAQGIYLNWKLTQESARLKIPFGIAQIGKAFRNEITPGNFIFRTREFEQMEMEFFVKPGDTSQWMDYWREQRMNWYLSLGVKKENLRWYEHPEDKLAHYAQEAWDIEYLFPFGWSEIEGVHDRGDFDLTAHQEASGKDMTYFDQPENKRYIPHIVETSAGLNRTMLMVLWDAYHEDEQAGEKRIYLKLDPKIAPIKAAILPLVKKDGLADIATQIRDDLRGKWRVFLDITGSIGKRYRRMDEIGTPFAFTIDHQTKEDNTVTVRWRDTLQQERINKDQIDNYLNDKL